MVPLPSLGLCVGRTPYWVGPLNGAAMSGALNHLGSLPHPQCCSQVWVRNLGHHPIHALLHPQVTLLFCIKELCSVGCVGALCSPGCLVCLLGLLGGVLCCGL